MRALGTTMCCRSSSFAVTELFLSLLPGTLRSRMFLPSIWLTAYDVPPRSTNSAATATLIAGEGRLGRKRCITLHGRGEASTLHHRGRNRKSALHRFVPSPVTRRTPLNEVPRSDATRPPAHQHTIRDAGHRGEVTTALDESSSPPRLPLCMVSSS